MNSLDSLFEREKKCKEHDCSINNKNIKIIYKPDNGFINKTIEKKLFGSDYKICDCIIECEDGNVFIVEIMCGKLTTRELREKKEQLENCFKVIDYLGEEKRVKKLFLLYAKLESPKKQPQLRKALLNQKIRNKSLIITNKITEINC